MYWSQIRLPLFSRLSNHNLTTDRLQTPLCLLLSLPRKSLATKQTFAHLYVCACVCLSQLSIASAAFSYTTDTQAVPSFSSCTPCFLHSMTLFSFLCLPSFCTSISRPSPTHCLPIDAKSHSEFFCSLSPCLSFDGYCSPLPHDLRPNDCWIQRTTRPWIGSQILPMKSVILM